MRRQLKPDEPCPGCGDGDKVPAHGYFLCPVCDAEWDQEDAVDAEWDQEDGDQQPLANQGNTQ